MSHVSTPVVHAVAGVKVLYVMATQAEYQSQLKARINPLICGVGPVEAAVNISTFLANNSNVDLVVSLGSAGSNQLRQTEVYQVGSVSYRDMDASPLGFKKGQTPFLDMPAVVPVKITIPEVPVASLSTGANIISGDDYGSIEAEMVDMETWAILRACHNANVPMIGLRGISDGAEPLAEYSDWTRYLEVIDVRLCEALDKLEAGLLDGQVMPVIT